MHKYFSLALVPCAVLLATSERAAAQLPDYWNIAQETHNFTVGNLLSPWNNYYSVLGDTSNTTEWHDASQIYADAAMIEYGDDRYEPYMDDAYGFMYWFWDTGSTIGGYFAIAAPDASWVGTDRQFVDDNSLTGVAYLDAYEATGNTSYLDSARAIANWLMYSGLWTSATGGGFQWNNIETYKPTQSNGLAIQLFLRLYEHTSESYYWSWASSIKSWLDSTLFDSSDGLYSWHTGFSSTRKFTYDQAIMIEANLIFYRITSNTAYRTAAQNLASNMHTKLWNSGEGGYYIHSETADDGHRMSPTLGGWASQSLTRLYEVDGNTTWLNRARANVDFFNTYLRDPVNHGYYISCEEDGSGVAYYQQAVDQAWMQRVQAILAQHN